MAIASTTLLGQPLDRITGKVLDGRGTPVTDAAVRVEAVFGFAGGDYLGQKTFATKTGSKGDWAILGFKAGIWVFDASVPGSVADVVVLPFNVVTPPNSGVGGLTPAWHPVLRPSPRPPGEIGQTLADAEVAARAGRSDRAVPLLARVADSNDVDVLTAAGRICLLMHDGAAARPFFKRALERDPQSFRAALGMASGALLQRDGATAGKAFHDARDRTTDKDERGYLAAAVADLNKANNVLRGTY
ncbi:MAG TPA: hypothetical protein VFA59_25785 [Vicinamibacterales bacterium]|nr:hypothetical protein [Vicinamibacterales bacterium]